MKRDYASVYVHIMHDTATPSPLPLYAAARILDDTPFLLIACVLNECPVHP